MKITNLPFTIFTSTMTDLTRTGHEFKKTKERKKALQD